MRRRSIVVLSPGGGHLQRLLPVVSALAARGCAVHVLTRGGAQPQVEAAGGRFVDLYARYPIDAVDAASIPRPCRLVTFAAAYADPLTADLAALAPALIVYDSFAVVAPIAARRLGIPYVGMRAGHAQIPEQARADIAGDPRVTIAPACAAAVEALRASGALPDASPFSYLDGLSPWLNLYPEPPAFLDPAARAAFEPVACFGSLAPDLRDASSTGRPLAAAAGALRVYLSFGTAIWTYYAAEALAAIVAIADAFEGRQAHVLVSLGHHDPGEAARRRLARPHVRVEPFVDQWGALKDADLFVTHHGLNSTHEAVYHQVPMLSYPFFGDQPALARRCQELGLALPLADAPRAALHGEDVWSRVETLRENASSVAARLVEARGWEIQTMDARAAVIDRMLALR